MFYQHPYHFPLDSTGDESSDGPGDTLDSHPACLSTNKSQGEECNEEDHNDSPWSSDTRI